MAPATEDEMERAVTALIPFVRRWHLQLNPEHLYQIAGAVLEHGRSDASYEEIAESVERELDEFDSKMRSLDSKYREPEDHQSA